MYSRAFIILYLATACVIALMQLLLAVYNDHFFPLPYPGLLEGTDYVYYVILVLAFKFLIFPLFVLPQIVLGAYILAHWARNSTYSIWKYMLLGTIMLGSLGIIIAAGDYIPITKGHHVRHVVHKRFDYHVFWSFSFAGLFVGWISWKYRAFYSKPAEEISE